MPFLGIDVSCPHFDWATHTLDNRPLSCGTKSRKDESGSRVSFGCANGFLRKTRWVGLGVQSSNRYEFKHVSRIRRLEGKQFVVR